MEKDSVISVGKDLDDLLGKKFDYYKDKESYTNSMLSWMKVSSAYFKKMWDEYPNEDAEDNQFLIFGNAVHCFVLEPNEFNKRYSVLEEPAPVNVVQKKFFETLLLTKKPLDGDYAKEDIVSVYESVYAVKGKSKEVIESSALDLYRKNKSYIDFMSVSEEKTAIAKVDMMRIEAMRKSIMDHDIAKTLIFDTFLDDGWLSVNEKELFWMEHVEVFDKVCAIPMKCKVDRILWNPKTKEIKIIDLKTNSLKTTKKSYLVQLQDDIINEYDYDRQAAVYRCAVLENLRLFFKDEFNEDDVDIDNYIVAVQSNIINETRVLQFTSDTLTFGYWKAQELLRNLAVGIECGFDHDAIYYLNDSKIINI